MASFSMVGLDLRQTFLDNSRLFSICVFQVSCSAVGSVQMSWSGSGNYLHPLLGVVHPYWR